MKFTTSFQTRVLVRRQNNKWNIWVSPKDTDGFIQAISRVSNESSSVVVAEQGRSSAVADAPHQAGGSVLDDAQGKIR